ncbi:rhombosortase [Photobacterium sp. ZSDE20]|uniref:Rhombosortase n=1 Tax=Photobacterium pectinilyticum TaxID=2906793 RepID=A0ABT1N3U1_9GAMM|nr:rhombosortase [Photobacterium sp. ZSDE20]MCQ1059408.1 rhombosortase [Photobacterium sp. ZSDE20]MDD1825199.1 rhombosortase [Photobacterium sp. ZSDE20]
MSIRIFVFIIIGIMAVAQLPSLQPLLVWQRPDIAHGEIWRLVSGNLTHTNWPHMIMNSLGLAIITFIFRRYLTSTHLALLILSISGFIGVTLWLSPMGWYAGLSGVLHGLFAWGAIQDVKAKDKFGWVLLVAVIGKALWEQVSGGSASSAELIGARVAVEAHLAGVLGGLLFAAAELIKKKIAIEN